MWTIQFLEITGPIWTPEGSELETWAVCHAGEECGEGGESSQGGAVGGLGRDQISAHGMEARGVVALPRPREGPSAGGGGRRDAPPRGTGNEGLSSVGNLRQCRTDQSCSAFH